jgi:hypothetical protein
LKRIPVLAANYFSFSMIAFTFPSRIARFSAAWSFSF